MRLGADVAVASVSSEMSAAIICARLRIRGVECSARRVVPDRLDVLVTLSDLEFARALLAPHAETSGPTVIALESSSLTARVPLMMGAREVARNWGEVVPSMSVEFDRLESEEPQPPRARKPRRERASMTAAGVRLVAAQPRRTAINGSPSEGNADPADATEASHAADASPTGDPRERQVTNEPPATLHTVRFRRGKVEFELTASVDAVADALVMLAPMLVTAFDRAPKSTVPARTKRGKPRKDK